ncbi:MAG: hypothetical protein KKC18_01500 [Chloroflexi bacterium]|nr:hypothetical protein [Chloroflexota bacterium]
MPGPTRQKHSLSLRAKIAVVSLLSLLVTTACSWLRLRATPTPQVTCYIMIEPTDTPTPVVMCYEMQMPTETPTLTTFISPLSPLPTPTLTPTPEARRLLRERLLAEGCFPGDVARQLEI